MNKSFLIVGLFGTMTWGQTGISSVNSSAPCPEPAISCDAFIEYTADTNLELDCGKAYSSANLNISIPVGPIEVYAPSIRMTEDFIVRCSSIFKADEAASTLVAEEEVYEIDKFDNITISAEEISGQAVYNWYDAGGNLIYVGKDLFIANAVAEKYKLEVISTDNFTGYTNVEVKFKPSRLISVVPNPSSDGKAIIHYKINEASSAYLMVTNYYMATNGMSNNYIVDIDATEKSIDLSNCPKGFYKVALVVDGTITDVKIIRTL